MYKRKQLNALLQLATIDNSLAGKESKFINKYARANGFSEEEIKELLRNPEPIGDMDALTDEERFENLYMIISLMKADGLVFKSEISFCEDIAAKLGYKKSVVSELSKHIYSDPSVTSDRKLLFDKSLKYRVRS
ncbi:MAG: TerB family tellurite resistance protein [Cyclobacteriaceae bacterium]